MPTETQGFAFFWSCCWWNLRWSSRWGLNRSKRHKVTTSGWKLGKRQRSQVTSASVKICHDVGGRVSFSRFPEFKLRFNPHRPLYSSSLSSWHWRSSIRMGAHGWLVQHTRPSPCLKSSEQSVELRMETGAWPWGASRVPFTIFISCQGAHHLLHTVVQDVLHLREEEQKTFQNGWQITLAFREYKNFYFEPNSTKNIISIVKNWHFSTLYNQN